jgi:hypothetical protein
MTGKYYYISDLIQWIPGAISAGLKRPGPKAGYLPAYSAEEKNGGAIPPYLHSPIYLHGIVLYYLSTGTNLPLLLSMYAYFLAGCLRTNSQ